jgi:hypothetical protein
MPLVFREKTGSVEFIEERCDMTFGDSQFFLLVILFPFKDSGICLAESKGQPFGIRAPGERGKGSFEAGQRAGFPSVGGEEMDLKAALFSAVGKKGEKASVGRPEGCVVRGPAERVLAFFSGPGIDHQEIGDLLFSLFFHPESGIDEFPAVRGEGEPCEDFKLIEVLWRNIFFMSHKKPPYFPHFTPSERFVKRERGILDFFFRPDRVGR